METLISAVSKLLLPESAVLALTRWVHDFEEWQLPMPSPNTVMWATVVALPVALIAHDTSAAWTPQSFQLPVLSWFQRRWKRDGKLKARDLRMVHDAVMFFYVAASLYEGNARVMPLDYVADRLLNATSRTILTREMQSKRSATFAASQGVLANGAFDAEKIVAMKETAMRRRMVQENLQQ